MQWFKLHHGFMTDPKYGLVARTANTSKPNVIAIVIEMLEHASKQFVRGDISTLDLDVVGFNLSLDTDIIRDVTRDLSLRHFCDEARILNWEIYQSPIDQTSAERSKRYREKQRIKLPSQTVTRDVTPNHVDKTRLDKNSISMVGADKKAPSPPPINEEINKPKKVKGTRLDREWDLPEAWGEWAEKQGLNRAKIIDECDKFKDYWIAKSGTNATKVDWEATWRNWIRKHNEHKGTKK